MYHRKLVKCSTNIVEEENRFFEYFYSKNARQFSTIIDYPKNERYVVRKSFLLNTRKIFILKMGAMPTRRKGESLFPIRKKVL